MNNNSLIFDKKNIILYTLFLLHKVYLIFNNRQQNRNDFVLFLMYQPVLCYSV